MKQNFITRLYRALTRKAVLLLTISILAGCSVVQLGYNNGESLTYWWLNSYVDINAEQKPWVKQRITNLFAWHRKAQVKDYAQFMGQGQKQLRHNVSKAELLTNYDELKKRAWFILEKALPDLAELTLSLQPNQIAQLEKKFASNNDNYRKDYLCGDLEQRQRFRYRKVMEQAEYWFGDFSREQEALIRRASDKRPLNNELWLGERLRRQQDLIALLKKIQAEKPSREATTVMLRDYAVTVFERGGSGEQEQFFNVSKEATANMAVVVINCTTPAQKARAIKKLQQWIDNFNALAARGT